MSSPKVAFTRRYAHGATTPSMNTRAEIEKTLRRFGCTKFVSGVDGLRGAVSFEHEGRRVKMEIPDPKQALAPYDKWPITKQIEAEERRLWRSLLMAIKAKLDMVESGITTFDVEFLPYMQLNDGRTFAEAAAAPEFVERLSAIGRPSLLALGSGSENGAIDAEFRER